MKRDFSLGQGKKDYNTSKQVYLLMYLLVIPWLLLLNGCQKNTDFSAEINDTMLSLPPVEFPAEKSAEIDSTSSEQDLEYDYTIDYYSAAEGYDEQIVLNPQTDVIYPGALIKGESIMDGSYVPISVKRKPITISTSLQGSGTVSVKVDDPKLSTVREAVNSLMNQEYDVPPANLGFTVENVYNREQMDMALHASYQSGLNDIYGSFDFSNTKIRSRVVAKFIQNYYTLDMDLPSSPSDLIDEAPNSGAYGSLMPMYISTVTFGRMAIYTVESELSETEVHTYLEGSYGDVEADASADFEKLSSKSTIKVYILGGSGADASAAINSFADFKKYIVQGGNYSKSSPGAPVSYKLRYIDDNTIAKVVFAASYPVRTAIPRTDNLRYDISVRLYKMKPQFSDGASDNNELYGTVKTWANSNPSNYHFNWNVSSGGTYLSLGKDQTHTFTNNSTTNRTYYNLKSSDKIVIRLNVKESDLWPNADEDLGVSYYYVPLINIIGPGSYTYFINNYGSGSSYMDVTFILSVKATKRI
ncbi:thiol-activated cytolysin family protein [Saccharicrinis sp. FJH62]|uniref:thiol-activated cytolysin family protein n=1 Tax=Saccharicrinis sp. FJH62 TaxID=3344657 RepID=UPI0035D49D44